PYGHVVNVPERQGFFVHDVVSHTTHAAAKTGPVYDDFVYWTFSGHVPSSDEPDGEPPRWRGASFVASYRVGSEGAAQVAFKGHRASEPSIDGLYLTQVPTVGPQQFVTVAETQMPATVLDGAAPAGALVTALGLERDGLRNGWLAISASMLDVVTSESWAGIYLTRTVPTD
ncbi:MAG: hypothetical protein OEW22_04885, partial [Rubrivivax sp.]|nr:hypothetical protein [Rubrivivax sp.]